MPITPAAADAGSPYKNLPVGDGPVEAHDAAMVVVHSEWNGWRRALVRVADLEDLQWCQPPGAPRALIHARVRCDRVISGDIPHDCADAPHSLFVCILKCRTAPAIYTALSHRAGASSSQTPCALATTGGTSD